MDAMPFSGRETILQKLCDRSGGVVDFSDLAGLQFLQRVAAPPLSLRAEGWLDPPLLHCPPHTAVECARLLDVSGVLEAGAAEDAEAAEAVRAHFYARLKRLLQPLRAVDKAAWLGQGVGADAEDEEAALVEAITALAEDGWGTRVHSSSVMEELIGVCATLREHNAPPLQHVMREIVESAVHEKSHRGLQALVDKSLRQTAGRGE